MLSSAFRAYLNAYRGLPRRVWFLSIVILLNRMGTMVLPYWALYMTKVLGRTALEAGTVLGFFGWGDYVRIAGDGSHHLKL